MAFKKVLTIIFLCTVLGSLHSVDIKDPNMKQGIELYSQKKYLDSIYFFNLVISEKSELFSEATFWKAQSLYSMGNYRDSKIELEDFFTQGSIVSAYYEDARYLYCKVFYKLDKYNESILLLNQYLRNKDFNYYRNSAYFLLGENYLQISDLPNSKLNFEKFLTIEPNSSITKSRLDLISNMQSIMSKKVSKDITIYQKTQWLAEYIILEQKDKEPNKVSNFIDSFETREDFFKWLADFSYNLNRDESTTNNDDVELLDSLESLLLKRLGEDYEN
ncbi:MAG: hypothetical protein JXR64_04545 [Spirochaetales bacterium]|nr:hypothetical protein [Spirochaetales bacterium]